MEEKARKETVVQPQHITVQTAIGSFDIGLPSGEFICKEPPGEVTGQERVIKTCLTRVLLPTGEGGEESMEPIVYQSCMQPEIKQIIPLVYREFTDEASGQQGFVLSTPYREIRFASMEEAEAVAVRTEPFLPVIKKKSCADCHNCGRC